jgi:aspartyl-tRNA(Asn)/glutamyl-tRNA(Gln) amidotransferase subunit B
MNDGTISGRIAKEVFDEMVESGAAPAAIVADKGLEQITDAGAIEAAVDAAIAAGLDQAENVRAGNDKAIGWFVGQVMKATDGKANPKMVNELLREKLKG